MSDITLQITIFAAGGSTIETPGCPFESGSDLYGPWVVAELRREADKLERLDREGAA